MKDKKTTDFGYEQVPVNAKASKVADVFHSVAKQYDCMNDVMSLGLHRRWKRFTLSQTGLKPGQQALDLAGGTGDLALKLAKQVGESGRVVLSDINPSMLDVGKNRMIDANALNVDVVEANAEALPFEENTFDCVTMAFGLRNVTHKDKALKEIFRVLKLGGKCLILEFSKPTSHLLNTIYDQYSFKLIPKFGKWIANDEASYQYLVESIRMHPDQETLLGMMKNQGFDQAGYFNLTGGIVALHYGYKV